MDAVKNEFHELTRNGIFDCQVCSSGTEDEALDWVRSVNPAGTTNNWQKSERDTHRPVNCSTHLDRKHYLFVC